MLDSKYFLFGCAAVLILTVVVEFMSGISNAAVSAVVGLAGCGLLVLVGHFVLRPLLQRAEDYYGGGEDDE